MRERGWDSLEITKPDIMSDMRTGLSRIALVGCLAPLGWLGLGCHDVSPRREATPAVTPQARAPAGAAAATRPAQVPILYAPGVAHFWVGREEELREIARRSELPGRYAWFIYVHASRGRADIFFSPEESTPRLRKGQFRQALGNGMLGFAVYDALGYEDYMQVSPSANEPFGSELSVPDASVLSLPVDTRVLSLAPGSVSDEAFVSIIDMVRAHVTDVRDVGASLLFIGVDDKDNVVIEFGEDDLFGTSLHFSRRSDGGYVYTGRGFWAF